MYWANDGTGTANRISWANLDGSAGGVVSTSAAPSGRPRGVALDVAAGRAYWTSPVEGVISYANLDGSGGGGLSTLGATVNRPNAAAVFPAEGRIYWANEYGNRISYADLDNSGGGDLPISGATVNGPIAPAVDALSRKAYWTNAHPGHSISWASLDTGQGGDLNTASATVNNPHGLALDPIAGRVYWANIGPADNRVHIISWTNLGGSPGGGDLDLTGATAQVPIGVAIDPYERRIFWANQLGNKISWANLDGPGAGDLPTPSGAVLNGSRSPVLLKAPRAVDQPGISGGSTTGSLLTCSRGAWAPDLLASWLYQAPQNFGFSWTLDGVALPGVTGNTVTATVEGDYRCTVTASNPAGSTSQTSDVHEVAPSTEVPPPVDPPPTSPPPASPVGSSAPPATSPPSSGPPAFTPLAFGTKTLVTMTVKARRIPSRGVVKVLVRNGNSFTVSGKLSARAAKRVSGARGRAPRISRTTFVVGPGAKSVIRLPAAVRRVLRRQRKLSLRLVATVTDPPGNVRTVTESVVLRSKV